MSSIIIRAGCSRGDDEVARLRRKHDRVVCLFDPNVAEHADAVARSFDADQSIPVPGGERAKNLFQIEALAEELLRRGCTRRSLIVNVGGGVLTDLGGFLAAIFMRGIDFVNVPTSMLAMCDAAIGGKTGVDLPTAKNTLGAFHPASLVLIDPELLSTLPAAELSAGLVEVVKMAAILDREGFDWLRSNLVSLLDREPEPLRESVELAVRLKMSVVDSDPREVGRRELLNFGHTVGHALESTSDFRISHGRAVSMGMIREMRIAGSDGVEPIAAALGALDMPIDLPAETDLEAIWAAMRHDKKNRRGSVRIAVPETIGRGTVLEIDKEQLWIPS